MASYVVKAGEAIITARLRGLGTEPKYIAWGTGAGTTTHADTTLFTESAESRTDGTSSQVTTTDANDTYQVTGAIVATATRAITNVGLFDAASGGNMLCKSDFSTVNIGSGDSITFTIKVPLNGG